MDRPVSRSLPARHHHGASGDDKNFSLAALIGFSIIGISFAIFVVGFRVFNPFDASWLSDDPATSYLGWKFFRNETRLTFPLGWSSAVAFPIGEPIAYFDPVPLLAMIFWPARHVLPADFQYFGLYFALNCVLQLCFGYRICRRLGANRLGGMAGGLLFMTAPPFILRTSGHFALTSHWLILAALDIFLAAPPRISRSKAVGSVALCVLAGGINPYLTFMVLLVLGAWNLRAMLSNGGEDASLASRVLHPVLLFGASVAAAVASLMIFGFLRPGELGTYPGSGYGVFSMNLLAPIDPMKFGSLLLGALPVVGNGQYEGYNYLGLGIIVLAVVALVRRPSVVSPLLRRDAIAVWVIIGVSLLLALSTKATVGSLILYDLSVPHWLHSVLSVFRGSGRLFWPAYYLILAGVIAAACGVFEGRKLTLILAAALLLQVADLRAMYARIHDHWQNSSASVFTDAAPWQMLGRDHRHLVVIPPWECDPYGTPGGTGGFWIFGKLAARQNMTTNSFYAARTSPKQREFFCYQQAGGLERDGLDEKTAYVFASILTVLPLRLRGHYCRPVDGVILCSVEAGREGLDESPLGDIRFTPTGELMPVRSDDTRTNDLFIDGWSGPESWGRWSDGPQAKMALRVADSSRETIVDFALGAFAPPGHPQRVEVLANGSRLANWTFDSQQPAEISLRVPNAAIGRGGIIILTFRMPDAVSPNALGLSGDTRRLGIAITGLRVTQNR